MYDSERRNILECLCGHTEFFLAFDLDFLFFFNVPSHMQIIIYK